SVPLSFFAGIGGASRNGILIKGGNYLEALSKVDTVVFDKTGTLTHGAFKVTGVAPAAGWTREQILDIAAHAESSSTHPIAVSLRSAHGTEIDRRRIAAYEEVAGHGISVMIDDKPVLIGNSKLMQAGAIPYSAQRGSGTVVYLGVDGLYAGHILISDELRTEAKPTISELRQSGVRQILMLTGDNQVAAKMISTALKLDGFLAELLPHQKVEQLEVLLESTRAQTHAISGGKLAFVGDGINDAPVLARSDVGIAMGSMGSDAAIEAADIVLMTDELPKIVQALRLSKKTMRIVWQNIIFALGAKSVVLVLGAAGVASMWMAVFADVGVALLATINAMRALRV
ncbi:MAG: HAD-IC family P-type ATPase, partial [Coriobacteriaceae bacterium]|nr:HAD-IC family P-type ATPase [Coriobacteriaceae bacterium]